MDGVLIILSDSFSGFPLEFLRIRSAGFCGNRGPVAAARTVPRRVQRPTRRAGNEAAVE